MALRNKANYNQLIFYCYNRALLLYILLQNSTSSSVHEGVYTPSMPVALVVLPMMMIRGNPWNGSTGRIRITTIRQSVGAFREVVSGFETLVVVSSGFLLAGRPSAAVILARLGIARAGKSGEAGIFAVSLLVLEP